MARRLDALAIALTLLAGAFGCRTNTQLGSLQCQTLADCAPPATVCGPDGRCVPGCAGDSDACVNGASCDPSTGECSGAQACADDSMCDPPASVCAASTHTCVVGCTLGPCADGLACQPQTGHCCDPSQPNCARPPDGGVGCNSDSECPNAPATICSAGACVPGCATSGCTAPLSCAASGHCQTVTCARDDDCDPGSYCAQTGGCTVLAFGGQIECAGGTKVPYRCSSKMTAGDFTACVGAAGPSGCPYCIDDSCFHPGLCQDASQCHRGDDCIGGLCTVQPAQCEELVQLADVVKGRYAAGKEVCVRDQVTSQRTGYDGMLEIKLGTSPYLFVDVAPMYAAAGVRIPSVGEVVTVHGVVRWDAGHYDRELLPVDWVSP